MPETTPTSTCLHLWAFTWNASEAGDDKRDTLIPGVDLLKQYLEERQYIDQWVFQVEFATRFHYQGKINCSDRKAKGTLLADFQAAGFDITNLTLRPVSSNGRQANALDFYCTKLDTRVSGPFADASWQPPKKKKVYEGKDLECMETPLQWQSTVLDWLGAPADDRTVRWIYNKAGNAGKSKLQKYLCWKAKATMVPMGTATQLKTCVIAKGAHDAYVCNIGRVSGNAESQRDLFSALEAIKDGFVESAMYGKVQTLFMEPPHVIVFSNDLPDLRLASMDRWKVYEVKDKDDFLHYLPTNQVLRMAYEAANKDKED